MKVRWTHDADKELLDLVAYVYPKNQRAALKLYKLTRLKVRQLVQFPNSGRRGRVQETRELVIRGTPYVAVYVIYGEAIWIAHVVHTSQQWPPEDE